MLGLTSLGVFHTAISLVAVGAAVAMLLRQGRISGKGKAGGVYVAMTVITCLTGFGIFQHGGFGKPHVLGIITLVVLGIAILAERTTLFGRLARYVATVSFSATLLFHLIPAVIETTTRLPRGEPIFAGPEAAGLQPILGFLALLFLIGAGFQVWRLRRTV